MRRKIWSGLLLVLSIIFGALFVESSDVSAFNFGNAYPLSVSGLLMYGNKGGTAFDREGYVPSNNNYYVYVSDGNGVDSPTYVNRIAIDLGNSTIPAHSIFTLSLRFNATGSSVVPYSEAFGINATVLNKYCQNIHTINNNQDISHLNCTYWVYTSSSISTFLNMNLGYVFNFSGSNQYLGTPTQMNYVVITNESGGSGGGYSGLTAEDKAYLSQQISTITSSVTNNTTALNQLKLLIQNQGESQQETLDNIQSAIEEQHEQEQDDRDNIEQQSEDISDSADDSAGDAEQVGTTLLGAFSAFVTALTSASPSNCNIDMDLGNLDLGVVNLCTLSPPQPIPTIASIFLILFCVPLSIATARKVINLFRSFQ